MNKKQQIDNLKRFQEIVIFLTILNIKNNFGTFEEYRNSSIGNKALKLHIAEKILRKISKYKLKEFISKSTHLFKYHKHCHKTFASGKKFTRNSWFEINEEFFIEENLNKLIEIQLNSLSYHSRQWIYKNIFDKQQGNIMTKAEKENLRIECEQGKHGLPYEVLVKDIEKKERRKKKSQEKRLKKAAMQANDELNKEIEKLKQQILEKDAEIKYLNQFKDITSDVPDNSPIEYEDLEKYFPDGIDEDDPEQQPLIKRISENCWEKIRLEGIRDAQERGVELPQKYIEYVNFDPMTRNIVNKLQKCINDRQCSVGFAKRACLVLTNYVVDFIESNKKWTKDDFDRTKEWRVNFFSKLFNNLEKFNLNKHVVNALMRQSENYNSFS